MSLQIACLSSCSFELQLEVSLGTLKLHHILLLCVSIVLRVAAELENTSGYISGFNNSLHVDLILHMIIPPTSNLFLVEARDFSTGCSLVRLRSLEVFEY